MNKIINQNIYIKEVLKFLIDIIHTLKGVGVEQTQHKHVFFFIFIGTYIVIIHHDCYVILVKNRAWSPPVSVPVPSHFLHQLLHQLRYHFLFDKWGSVIYGCDHIIEAFDLAPILGQILG